VTLGTCQVRFSWKSALMPRCALSGVRPTDSDAAIDPFSNFTFQPSDGAHADFDAVRKLPFGLQLINKRTAEPSELQTSFSLRTRVFDVLVTDIGGVGFSES
jgi:hypothetical protein